MCEPWLENNEGDETGSACGSEEARVCGSGLLVTAGSAQAGWLSGVQLRKSAGLDGRGEVHVMAGACGDSGSGARLGTAGDDREKCRAW